jgi:hypothetical protein
VPARSTASSLPRQPLALIKPSRAKPSADSDAGGVVLRLCARQRTPPSQTRGHQPRPRAPELWRTREPRPPTADGPSRRRAYAVVAIRRHARSSTNLRSAGPTPMTDLCLGTSPPSQYGTPVAWLRRSPTDRCRRGRRAIAFVVPRDDRPRLHRRPEATPGTGGCLLVDRKHRAGLAVAFGRRSGRATGAAAIAKALVRRCLDSGRTPDTASRNGNPSPCQLLVAAIGSGLPARWRGRAGVPFRRDQA